MGKISPFDYFSLNNLSVLVKRVEDWNYLAYRPDFEHQLTVDTLTNRINYQPFFNPPHPWVAITGRPPIDKNATMEWFRRYFKNPPQEIYFNTTFKTSNPHNGAQHKSEIITKLGLTLYVESCHQQAKEIQDLCPDVLVIQFSDLVEKLYIQYII